MKCKNCNKCSQRGNYQYIFCDEDNHIINPEDYYGGKEMNNCIQAKIENKEFLEDYICYTIARK